MSSASVMAQRVREKNWGATPIGDPETWPVELKTAMGMLIDSKFPGAIVWGPSHTTIYNDAFLPILGEKQNTLGESFATIWAEAWSEIEPLVRRAMGGEAIFIENFPLRVLRKSKPEQAYFTFCYSPIRMADGSIGGMMDTVMETTETVNALAERALISDEMAHRMKNAVTLIQALCRQTLKGVEDRAAVDAFEKRLNALGAAHETLLRQNWDNVSMQEVMHNALGAIAEPSRFNISGCDIDLGPKSAVALSLLLHELATNALKYGALSQDEGSVSIECSLGSDSLVMIWKETGGPAVSEPVKRGFGSRIIGMGLGGTACSEFRPSGLTVCIETNLIELQSK
jgi:two-component sensor histidine kinase